MRGANRGTYRCSRRPSRVASQMRQIVLLVMAVPVIAQQPAPRALPPPLWTSVESFSSIGGVRELSDGRLIVLDAKERRIALLGSDGKLSAEIGRQGAGPGEFRFANRHIALPGDTTFVPDQSLRRFLVIDEAGKAVATIPFPEAIASGLISAHSADAEGRLVFAPYFASRRDDGAPEDAPLLAWSHRTNRVDTIATIRLQRSKKIPVTGGIATYNIRYSPADAWLPLSTGEVAILHPEGYREEIIGRGSPNRLGPVTLFDRVRVADEERVPKQVAADIPDVKPPFWDREPLAGPSGELWSQRSAAFGASERLWDVFDRTATRVRTYALDKSLRIASFGRQAIYVIRTDGDGLEWIEKRPIPRRDR